MPQKLLVFQSLWAMERRRPDGVEWPLSEKLAMIRDAGFDGAGVRFVDADYAREVTGFLRAHGRSWQAQCYPHSEMGPIDCRANVATVQADDAEFLAHQFGGDHPTPDLGLRDDRAIDPLVDQ